MDTRQKLLAAKRDIEQKAKIKFSKESIALADLISEFIAIKVGAQEQPQKIQAQSPIATTVDQGGDVDPFYLD
jgi:hypothetical protein